ncbi:hypothetical protein [Micromonospora chokoriensis]|uniref:hypothetical protein n=1 Tax=Micromonospora chokoriensis TaxID=356851 RepID=UPI000B5ACE3C|nr:hypothetical protein [Micromonospora chokoriensis]
MASRPVEVRAQLVGDDRPRSGLDQRRVRLVGQVLHRLGDDRGGRQLGQRHLAADEVPDLLLDVHGGER